MAAITPTPRFSRRRFVAGTTALTASVLLAACGGAPAAPTAAPKAVEPTKPAAAAPTTAPAAGPTTAPAAAATTASAAAPTTAPAAPTSAPAVATTAPAPTAAPAAAGAAAQNGAAQSHAAPDVGRHRGQVCRLELWNRYAVGANQQNGLRIFYEPLALLQRLRRQGTILWLAESYKYSPDFKELTIKTRSGITWSDGKPFRPTTSPSPSTGLAKRQGAKVRWGIDVQQFVDTATATDANTVQVKFKVPAPRFFATS